MGRIETRIKNAIEKFKQDTDLVELLKEVADVGDRSVNCTGHAAIMYDAIRQYCPKPLFECVFYDGENGDYHLLDFDPNGLGRGELLMKIRAELMSEYHIEIGDFNAIGKAIETVYLLNTNTLIRVHPNEVIGGKIKER